MRTRLQSRRGATTLEFAAVASVTLPLLLGMLVGGLGVFHYQQVAYLARGIPLGIRAWHTVRTGHGKFGGHGQRRLQPDHRPRCRGP